MSLTPLITVARDGTVTVDHFPDEISVMPESIIQANPAHLELTLRISVANGCASYRLHWDAEHRVFFGQRLMSVLR